MADQMRLDAAIHGIKIDDDKAATAAFKKEDKNEMNKKAGVQVMALFGGGG